MTVIAALDFDDGSRFPVGHVVVAKTMIDLIKLGRPLPTDFVRRLLIEQ